MRDETRLVWVETPTNPLLNVVDIAGVVARARGALVAVDNTFATPVNQRPLELGADAVVHSATKYLGGHSDTVGGAVVVRDAEALHEQVRFVQNAIGAVPGPVRLLPRAPRPAHAAPADGGARRAAPRRSSAFLRDAPRRQRRPLARLQRDGLASATPTRSASRQRTKLFTLAESLGGVESLIEVPQAMTHQSVEGSAAAVPADLVRLSCGVEDPEDLVADLRGVQLALSGYHRPMATTARPQTGSAARADRSPAQWFALVVGVVLLLAGVLGFVTDSTFETGSDINGDKLLGLEVNGIHNIVHILSGLLLLAGAGARASARTVTMIFAAAYLLVTVIGPIDGETVLGLIPVNGA